MNRVGNIGGNIDGEVDSNVGGALFFKLLSKTRRK